MSVLKSQRKLSGMEFFHNAYKIRTAVVSCLLRDFGIRVKIRKPENIAKTYKLEPEDVETFNALVKKYKIQYIEEEYPEWLITYFRKTILQEVRMMIRNITQANSIYATSFAEFDKRREYQTQAIGCCEQLLQEFQFLIMTIDVDVNKFLPYVELIQKEIALLKGWRKSDNRMKEGIAKNEAERLFEREMELEKLLYYDIHGDKMPPRLKMIKEQNVRRLKKISSMKKKSSEQQDETIKKKFKSGEYDKEKVESYMNEYKAQLKELKEIDKEMGDAINY